VPPIDFGTLQGRIAATQVLPRFQSMLVGAFALVAMLLAAAGLYASMAHSVGRRQQEMGVRMALGAGRAGVLRLVLGQGMGLATAGLAVGVVATMASTRFLASFLYGVRPNDPATLAMTSVLLLLVSAVACLAPARRATSVDPVRVLKAE
jgi:ABC-type antimicrobial peptide transport system permease subunit